jgi:hypothetical protein
MRINAIVHAGSEPVTCKVVAVAGWQNQLGQRDEEPVGSSSRHADR